MSSLTIPRPMGVRDLLHLPMIGRRPASSRPTATGATTDRVAVKVSAPAIVAPNLPFR
jgi:hypothetical protein